MSLQTYKIMSSVLNILSKAVELTRQTKKMKTGRVTSGGFQLRPAEKTNTLGTMRATPCFQETKGLSALKLEQGSCSHLAPGICAKVDQRRREYTLDKSFHGPSTENSELHTHQLSSHRATQDPKLPPCFRSTCYKPFSCVCYLSGHPLTKAIGHSSKQERWEKTLPKDQYFSHTEVSLDCSYSFERYTLKLMVLSPATYSQHSFCQGKYVLGHMNLPWCKLCSSVISTFNS